MSIMARTTLLDEWIVKPGGGWAPSLFYAHPEVGMDDITGEDGVPGDPNGVILGKDLTLDEYYILTSDPIYENRILTSETITDETT